MSPRARGRAGRRRPSGARGGVSLRQDRRLRAPEVPDALVAPAEAVLVRVGRVVLGRDVVAEEEIGERLEAVRVLPGDVERDRVLVADVEAERLAGPAVEDDHPGHALKAGEEIVLAALVVVQPPDHALARERDVGLPRRLRQLALAPD